LDGVTEFNAGLRFGRAPLRLLDVAGKAQGEANLAGRQRIEIFQRMEFAHIRPDLDQKVGDFFEIAGIARIRIALQISQSCGHDVVG
jgi:hypothetical protein